MTLLLFISIRIISFSFPAFGGLGGPPAFGLPSTLFLSSYTSLRSSFRFPFPFRLRFRMTSPPSPSVLPAAAAARLISSVNPPLVIDSQPSGLYAIEHLRHAIPPPQNWPSMCQQHDIRIVLVYDCGSTKLSMPHSRAAAEVWHLHKSAPHSVALYLVEGGLPGIRIVAPHLITRSDTITALPSSISRYPWAVRAFLDAKLEAVPPARVLPALFVGAASHATDPNWLHRHEITHVIAVGDEFHTPPSVPSVKWLRLPVRDAKDEDLLTYFPAAVSFLDSARAQSGVSVVHCQAGASRSVAVVVAYLISHAWSLEDALHHVKCLRSAANPNPGFLAQLARWQSRCVQRLQSTSVSIHGVSPDASAPLSTTSRTTDDSCLALHTVHCPQTMSSTSPPSPRHVSDIDFGSSLTMRSTEEQEGMASTSGS